MRRNRPIWPMFVFFVALAGCTTGDVVLDKPAADYVQDVSTWVAAVDWSQAEPVTVELSGFNFKPDGLVFEEGIAYRLVLRNTGKRKHTFVSEGFFKAIAAHKLISADGVRESPYLEVVEVPPGAVKAIYFVPVRKGTYPLRCSVFLHAAFGMEGQITID